MIGVGCVFWSVRTCWCDTVVSQGCDSCGGVHQLVAAKSVCRDGACGWRVVGFGDMAFSSSALSSGVSRACERSHVVVDMTTVAGFASEPAKLGLMSCMDSSHWL